MKCLYSVSGGPITPNGSGGGCAVYYAQLMALTDLGVEVVLWHQATPLERRDFEEWTRNDPDIWKEVQSRCSSVELSTISPSYSVWHRARNRFHKMFRSEKALPPENIRLEFLRHLQRVRPDFVWAQHVAPAMVATSQETVPVIYSHTDWLFRIMALRSGGSEDLHRKAQEYGLVKRIFSAVSGSATECQELTAAGCKYVHYIPVSYAPVSLDWSRFSATPRLIHVGGMGTTANRVGLMRFFEVVWPDLQGDGVDFEVIGDTSSAPEPLKAMLAGVRCTGFVKNLVTVLRPGDLHIFPWEHNNGQRTRLPLAFNHGQVVVATRASVACFPEARDGENCRLVSQLADMAGIILELRRDREQRIKLAENARRTFEQSFTRSALLPRYAEVLAEVQSQSRS